MSIEVYYINAFSERTVTYDRNGNILSLTWYGADTAVPEEALAYSYNGNMLVGVSNSGSSGGGGSYTHDANGNLTRDGLSGLDIEYDDLNLTSRVSSGDTTLAVYGHLADGTKICSVDGTGNGLQYRGSLVYTQTAGQSGSPILTLDCALTSAGRIVRWTAADGSVSYRSLIHLRDHLGSVRAVIDGDTGTVIEANDYYPFGKRIPTPVTEPVAPTSPNRWLFSGKESQSFLSASIPLLDFGARMYDPLTARWTAQDPLAEKYYAVSPYAYCLGNPITFIDPNGESTWVKLADDGTYVVIEGGNAFDNDLNVYMTFVDENGHRQRGESIGKTVSPYSFFNTDGEGTWAVGSVINPNDASGSDFLQMFYDKSQPELIDYMLNARNGRKYDFKVTNGEDIPASGTKRDPYRGMPIGKENNGQAIYASARDIGNIAAGYVAGTNGIGWLAARAAFDGYQILSNINVWLNGNGNLKSVPKREGLSTRVPEYHGWTKGYLEYKNKHRLNWYLYDR